MIDAFAYSTSMSLFQKKTIPILTVKVATHLNPVHHLSFSYLSLSFLSLLEFAFVDVSCGKFS